MADLNMATAMSLSGRVGLVTGGGTGIGFMIAKAFAANGAKVYITGRRLDVLEQAAASVTGVPGFVVPIQMDVTDEESVKAGVKHIEGIDGKLDILVNNAGIAGSLRDPDFTAKKFAATDPFEPETVQTWTDLFALNTIAPFFVVRAFQSLLVKGARSRHGGTATVINVSSVATKMNTPGPLTSVAYLMTKSALDKLTLVLGASFAQRGIPIRVNVLAPGVFASQLISPEVLEAIKTKPLPGLVAPIPAKRQGTEVEMGMTAVYLAVSDYTNGAVLTVDGGISLVNP
ncbi:related to dehydrogenases with different specificities (related to short-chain alcohol dehydrogenases) [Armillaria ostoyae]|uniref:Related to dehydrogenases with different specificities (Related to short-chain alcohol dehydrogenases) n=1 Tax=Armillaria ostoyae TaxID=47428 RepID=A0A284RSG2_ARMOS|nr:related to dehydrogenases with different specificities (related to short-chain alcohol dehydrogenases) [Armillaria ostoyae]